MAEDLVILRDLRLKARIGCYREEREKEQDLLVDCQIVVDTKKAAQSKDLADSVCYLRLRNLVLELAQSKEWTLVEEFAESICEQIFATFKENAGSVRIQVKKLVFDDTAWVGVELNRSNIN